MVTRGNFARLGPRGYALVALIALFGAFASAAPALASKTGYSDIVEFGENITVPAGKDVGDVVDFGGDERVYGHVHGDAVVFGGSLYIQPGGLVDGDTVSFGGAVHDESHPNSGAVPAPSAAPETPPPAETPAPAPPEASGGGGAWPVFVLVDALLTLFAFVLFPVRTAHSLDQLREQPLWSVVLGVFSPILFTAVVIVLAITVLGIPLIPVVSIALLLAYYIGKAAIALFIGQRFLESSKVAEPRPIVAALIGLLVLLIVTGPTPLWFAVPMLALIGCVAIGAALVSFVRVKPTFGTPLAVRPTAFAPPAQPPASSPPAIP